MDNTFEVHDSQALAQAKAILNATESPREWAQAVIAAVNRNEEWRGKRCINLLAPEAPTSPTVRALLSAEIGTRAAEGHIGRVNRWFAGTQYIDEVEALCVELLKLCFRSRYADHRLMGSMLGNMAVYHAMAHPGDVVMSAAKTARTQGTVTHVAFLDRYLLANEVGTYRCHYSDVNAPDTWSAYWVSKEAQFDLLKAVVVANLELYLIGERTMEVWLTSRWAPTEASTPRAPSGTRRTSIRVRARSTSRVPERKMCSFGSC